MTSCFSFRLVALSPVIVEGQQVLTIDVIGYDVGPAA